MTKYSFLLVFLVFLSCSNEDMTFKIGGDYIDVHTNIHFIDTLTVKSYTVMMDSIQTSGLQSPAIMVGNYSDPEFGTITSTSYFRVGMPALSYSIPKNAVFDSLHLILLYDQYATGDTTKSFTINVHRLEQTLKPNDDTYFYNTSSFKYAPDIFGSSTFIPRPGISDTLWIDIDNNFGDELFNLLKEKDDKVTDILSFRNYFKGMVLTGVETNDAILGFQFKESESSQSKRFPTLRLYYHYFDFENVFKYIDLPVQIGDYDMQFNQIKLTEPRYPFPTKQRDKLPSHLTGNRSFVMAGVGLTTRFEIPYLKNLLSVHENIRIVKAELQIEPLKKTYKIFPLPEKVSLYSTDEINRFGSAITNVNGDVQTGDLQIDDLFQVDTWYSFDITNFCESKLQNINEDTAPALLLTVTPENLYKTIDRLIIGNPQNSENKVTLKVYYLYYE